MTPTSIVLLIAGYFAVLMLIARLTSKGGSNANFFLAGKNAPWFLVAFGMIGASLSGITFISVPGMVGKSAGDGYMGFSYMQMVLGYFVGYLFIAFVLMPVYYKLNVTSIYTYLERRFGVAAYKTGAFYFLLSRTTGASIRLLLVANVLQEFVFAQWGVPFEATVALSILLIWIYTYRGGIGTIIWTDTLQTLFMLLALGISLFMLHDALGIEGGSLVSTVVDSDYSQWFFFDNAATSGDYFWKQFIGGFFITIGMTGMDQDMMQKNLACKNIFEAKKNMLSFAAVLVIVNALFLGMGVLLYLYAAKSGIELPVSESGRVRTDQLFPVIALQSELSGALSIFFLLGLIAAAYSSADSALTSLTTSVCVDFLGIEKREVSSQQKLRMRTHRWMSVALFAVILLLHYFLDLSAIGQLIFLAGFTYGPLIGLFLFGLTTKRILPPGAFVAIAVAAPILTWLITAYSTDWFGFNFGALHIALNAVLTYGGLWLVSAVVKTGE